MALCHFLYKQDLKDRYEFIGGLSPLAGTTDDQADALVSALNKAYADVEFKLYLGLKSEICFNPKYSLNSTSAYALFNAETSASAWSSVVHKCTKMVLLKQSL
jgi:hypothetical protein